MTTDLTGDFELGEDEFDWDVFLPDSDEADGEDVAVAFEDETDESDFDWDGALRDDTGPESGADDGARAGAAYDRIVDTVRRSFEDEPSTPADSEPETDTSPVVGADEGTERRSDGDRQPVVAGFAASFADPVESEAHTDPVVASAAGVGIRAGCRVRPGRGAGARIDMEGRARARARHGVRAGIGPRRRVPCRGPEADLEAGEEGRPRTRPLARARR